ncbi:MAG TPA: alpha/beta hydrolase, partial [Candidatus Methylomirabilis sp.]
VTVGDVRLYYEERGRGTPIVFIPGLIGLGAQWSFQVDHFAKGYRVITFDHRGAGQSDRPVQEYSTALLARDVVGLLDALGILRAHVVGASTGGAIGQVLGLDHADRVLSLTLVSTWARPDAYFRRLQEMRKEVLLGLGVPAYIRLSSLWTAGLAQFRDMLDRLEAYEAEQVRQAAPVAVMATRIDATLKHDRLADLGRIAAPTMVVVAEDDTLVPPHLGEQIAATVSGARLARMKGGGHNCYRKDPGTFKRLLADFLGDVA